MVTSLADRLNAERQRTFVGRAAELALFQSALASPELPFSILYVYGPGGIGKTTLLREFMRWASDAGARAFYFDARAMEPTPDAVMSAVRQGIGVDSAQSFLESLHAVNARVLLFDTYESLAPLDNWFRDIFLPQLPDNTLVVLAGRHAPSEAWLGDSGWQSLTRVVSLRNLSPDESRAYLAKRAVPGEQYDRILDFTHGHALALSLVADTFSQRKETNFEPGSSPDMVKTLLELFVQKVPGPAHRAALEVCALVRVTTEGLLAHMLGLNGGTGGSIISEQGAHDLFEWLRGLSFIESSREGIFPHDMARATLSTDLRWRNPDWYRELHDRARSYYMSHVRAVRGVEQQAILYDYVFLHRDNSVIRSMLEWQGGTGILPDAMREADRAVLLTMVEKHEGTESAHVAARWLERQPEGVTVYRDEKGKIVGFIAIIALERAAVEELNADPATRAAWDYLGKTAPLRPGEVAAHYRFWMADETYQNVSPVQTLIFLNTVRYQLTTPGLAYHFLPTANPEMWAGAFAYANLTRLEESDYEVGGNRYGVYGHDWRAQPPLAWLALLAEREVDYAPVPEPSAASLLVLSADEFAKSVQDALKNYSAPDRLRDNPLLRSRLIVEQVGPNSTEAERITALLSLLRNATESLQSSPREKKLYDAIYHTYIKPETTQERAAEVLDLPFSTYRRHLKTGLTRVVEALWKRELRKE